MPSPHQIPSRILEQKSLSADFVVIGGGMAGVCAALAAARNGASVVLVQDRSVLGGNASSEIKMHIVGADCHGHRPGARESGIIEELRLEDSVRNAYRSYPQWDLLLYEKVKAEENITLLLDATFVSCVTDPETGKITRATVLKNLTEELFEIEATFFADCSGDGRLGAEAGADFRMGQESQAEYGESLGQPEPTRLTLGSSILITGKKMASPQPFIAPSWIRKFTKEELKHRPIHSYEYGYWWFEWGGQLDTIKDNEAIRHELLRIALGVWDYVKNSGDHPDADCWVLDWVGAIPGKRESRRFLGKHVLVQSDLMNGRLFRDAVAYGGWLIDLHPPTGIDDIETPPAIQTQLKSLYTIPLGSLVSRNVPNLLFAGRNISASHVAFGSTRVMATCAVMGQAVGTAVALAAEEGLPLSRFADEAPLQRLQQRLLRDDAFIPGIANEDAADKARKSRVTASSSKEGCEPERVLDGITRDLDFPLGTWADGQKHHWQSELLPAQLTLEFDAEVEIHEVHLTFDSGFARELMLSASDHLTDRFLRGAQPETVKTYRLLVDGKVIAEEANNYLRKRIHTLPAVVKGKTLTVEILATHGVDTARVFEVRVY